MALKINKDAFRVAKENVATIGVYDNVTLEPGRYQAYVKKARVVDSDKGQQVVFDLQVPAANDGQGGVVSIWNKTDEESLHYLLKTLSLFGYDIDKVESGKDVEDIIEAINGENPVVKIQAKRSGEYTNYYINELMQGVTAADIDDKAGEGSSEGSDNPAPKGAKPGTPAAKATEKTKATPAATKTTASKTSGAAAKKPAPAQEEEPAAEEEEAEPAAEDEAAPEGEEEVQIAPGLKCKGKVQGKMVAVEIVEVDEDADFIRYKDLSKGGKVWKIKASKAGDFLELP